MPRIRFFKLVEIEEKEYEDKTDDFSHYSDYLIQTTNKEDDGIYIAIDTDCEPMLMVDLSEE